MDGGWCTDVIKGCYGVSLWKYIMRDWVTFSQNLQFEVRDGKRINFGIMYGVVIYR